MNIDYRDYVTMVAHNTLDQKESPRFVAEHMIVDSTTIGGETAIYHSAEPFVDDPSTQTRLWPKDVLTGTDRDTRGIIADDLRDLAVEVFLHDLYQAMQGIENDTARPWGEA